jgi:hypothetical protein
MGELSPECRRCEWIAGATGPAVGARFKGTNQHPTSRMRPRSLCYWYDTYDANTGKPFGGSMGLGLPA